MQDISKLSKPDKEEIAGYIKRDTLLFVNKYVKEVHPKNSFYVKYGKRVCDIIISSVALFITLPINFLIGIITFLDVGRPIFFIQQRIGKDGKTFNIVKFRNMTNETDENGELLPPTQRVTKWGRFVRKTSLDELLNFWSVFTGTMSIVGPRPLLDTYAERFNDRHKQRYVLRPGLECPSLQTTGNVMSWQERLENDIWYVENCSLWTDIKLCFRIVQVALDRKATATRSNADQGGFLGYDLDGNVICTKSVPDIFVEEFCEKHGFVDLQEAISFRLEGKSLYIDFRKDKAV